MEVVHDVQGEPVPRDHAHRAAREGLVPFGRLHDVGLEQSGIRKIDVDVVARRAPDGLVKHDAVAAHVTLTELGDRAPSIEGFVLENLVPFSDEKRLDDPGPHGHVGADDQDVEIFGVDIPEMDRVGRSAERDEQGVRQRRPREFFEIFQGRIEMPVHGMTT